MSDFETSLEEMTKPELVAMCKTLRGLYEQATGELQEMRDREAVIDLPFHTLKDALRPEIGEVRQFPGFASRTFGAKPHDA